MHPVPEVLPRPAARPGDRGGGQRRRGQWVRRGAQPHVLGRARARRGLRRRGGAAGSEQPAVLPVRDRLRPSRHAAVGHLQPPGQGLPLDTCREVFCLAGPEGYYGFLNLLVGFIKEYATGFGGLFACLVLVQLVLLVNLWNLRRRFKADQTQENEVRHSSEMGFQVMAGGSVLDPSGRPIGNVRSSQSRPRAGSVAVPKSRASGVALQKDDLRRGISL